MRSWVRAAVFVAVLLPFAANSSDSSAATQWLTLLSGADEGARVRVNGVAVRDELPGVLVGGAFEGSLEVDVRVASGAGVQSGQTANIVRRQFNATPLVVDEVAEDGFVMLLNNNDGSVSPVAEWVARVTSTGAADVQSVAIDVEGGAVSPLRATAALQ